MERARAICASVSASISLARIRPRNKSLTNLPRVGRKRPVVGSTSVGSWEAGKTGDPSTRTMWHPAPREGEFVASEAASVVASAKAIRVAEVRVPSRFSSRMARLTPAVRPKSSAFTMSRFTRSSVSILVSWAGCPPVIADMMVERLVRALSAFARADSSVG